MKDIRLTEAQANRIKQWLNFPDTMKTAICPVSNYLVGKNRLCYKLFPEMKDFLPTNYSCSNGKCPCNFLGKEIVIERAKELLEQKGYNYAQYNYKRKT